MNDLGPRDTQDLDLDRAIAACRASGSDAERLSPEARATLFDRVARRSVPARSFSPLFPPIHRWVAAGIVPAIAVLAVSLWVGGGFGRRSEDTTASAETAIRLEAAKVGDRVVFSVRNGGRDHVVARSETPDGVSAAPASPIERGTFEDRLDAGPGLVFYRID